MNGAELEGLEREVAEARKRLADDLSRLRSPSALGQFKDTLLAEASDAKNALIDKSKQAATDGLQRFVADLKERAAANPVAAVMIGAGLAWRLVQRPPIASFLVGMGVWSLWRDNDHQKGSNGFASQAKELTARAGESLGELASAASEQASRSAADAAASLKGAAAIAVERTAEAASQLREQATGSGKRASAALQRVGSEEGARDRLLFGAAAVAVAAAVGMAAQHKIADGHTAER